MELPNDTNELKQLVYTLIDEIVSLKTEVATLKSQVASLEKENAALRKENAELKQENILLKIEISELKARLNQNSSNSSKPPSSDYFNRKPAFSKTSVGKKGDLSNSKRVLLSLSEQAGFLYLLSILLNDIWTMMF